jgi:signal transduction histidine kinase
VRYGARDKPITLVARGDADGILLRVRNYGRVIPADQLQVIFNPLVQVPTTQAMDGNEPCTNLGLGLYIAHEIVTLHGGSLEARSDETGTEFSASLPRAQRVGAAA